MKKSLAGILFAAIFPMSSMASTVVELNLGHVLAPQSHYHAVATRMAELALEKSNNTLKINVFPSGQLGGEVKLIQSARTGAVPLVITGEPPLENTVKEFGIFSLPYLFPDLDSANRALQADFGKKMLGYLDQHGLIGLGWISVQERNIYGSQKIEAPADMKDLKIRVIQSPGYVDAYEKLGAQATPMAYSEVYLALQTGVIDGGETSPDLMIDDKFAEVSKFYNMVKIHYMPCVIIMSKSAFNRLSPDHQKVIQEAADEAAAHGIKFYGDAYKASLDAMTKSGVTIVQSDIAAFKDLTAGLYGPLLKNVPNGQENVDLARQAAQ